MYLRPWLVAWLLAPTLLMAQSTTTPPARSSKVDPAFVAAHDAALRRARVWFKPEQPIAEADLGVTNAGPDGFLEDAVVNCTFKIEGAAGTTPKFACALPDGDEIKVKYGRDNPEVYTEVIATRLLNALGFPADRMYPVAKVRCFGCSADPFKDLQCLNEGLAEGALLSTRQLRALPGLRPRGHRAAARRTTNRDDERAGLVVEGALDDRCEGGRFFPRRG